MQPQPGLSISRKLSLNTGSNILLRGFTPGRAVDGINVIQAQPFFEPEYAIYDRLEIVKGPASVVYGVD
jgi:outer membrane receptor protein involved in Fe transport